MALESKSLWWLVLYSLYHRNFLASFIVSAAVSFGALVWVVYLGLSLFTLEMRTSVQVFSKFPPIQMLCDSLTLKESAQQGSN